MIMKSSEIILHINNHLCGESLGFITLIDSSAASLNHRPTSFYQRSKALTHCSPETHICVSGLRHH